MDSFIRRICAQRDCLNEACRRIAAVEGPVVELGLGNGRTFDHLREHLPDREIFVFEREPRAHKESTPDERFMITGDLRETLPHALASIGHPAALLHSDIGCGYPEIDRQLAGHIARWLPSLVTVGGIVLSDQVIEADGFWTTDLPPGTAPGRYTMLVRGA